MEEIKKDRKKIIKVTSLIISIVLIIAVGTFAWFTWSSTQNTELTMTIGQLAEVKFETGNDISTNSLGPVLDYNDGEITTFNIQNKADYQYYTDIILNIDSIAIELQNESLKYKILSSSDNKTFNTVKDGDFKDIKVGSNKIYSPTIQSKTTTYYKFILYIDGNMENNVNMMGKSIVGNITVEASDTLSRTSDEMLQYLGLTVNAGTPDFNIRATANEGIYSANDDYGKSYYFRGASTKNYVKFAGIYWRIIRINGDGTIRMIYDGTSAHSNGEISEDRQIGTDVFNENATDNAYAGYMYGVIGSSTYEETHLNTNNSAIKNTVDNWYKTNIVDTGFSSKIADVVYCNDRKVNTDGTYTGNGVGKSSTSYGRYRLISNKMPILTCSQKNDAFTVDDEVKGNRALTYPVGLITADEVSMSGSGYVTNSSSNSNFTNLAYYLYTGYDYWTMSPSYYSRTGIFGFIVALNGEIVHDFGTNGVRPVLSLKSSIQLTGTGTQSDPFVVQ